MEVDYYNQSDYNQTDYNQTDYNEVKLEPHDILMRDRMKGHSMMYQDGFDNGQDSNPGYSCEFCNHKCGTMSGIRNHMHRKHPDLVQASKTYKKKNSEMVETDDKNSDYLADAKYQVKKEKLGGKVKVMKKCPDCEQSFASMFLRLKHIRATHPERKIFNCRFCKGHKYIYFKSLTDHIEKKHPEQNSDGNEVLTEKNYKSTRTTCPICKGTFNSVSGMMTHYTSVHPEAKVYDCSVCDKRYLTLEGLQYHNFPQYWYIFAVAG